MADSQRKTALLNDNPLCGISTYKDTLNLATGACTRQIKKLVLTGQEDWSSAGGSDSKYFRMYIPDYPCGTDTNFVFCTHFTYANISSSDTEIGARTAVPSSGAAIYIRPENASSTSVSSFQTYLAQQYANGTPVTVWYVLATSTTETITVPSGLSGTEEGYLNQSGTPTPTNPIYPTANNVEVWQHSLRKLGTSTDTLTTLSVDLYADGNNATVGLQGNMTQTGTPTQENPITPQETGDLETTGEHAGQYKIPISSANTTTSVYLGEVQSTRRIKKMVLDGTETFSTTSSSTRKYFRLYIPNHPSPTGVYNVICTHFENKTITSDTTDVGVMTSVPSQGAAIYFRPQNVANTDANDFKNWLAAQYSNGTPVTVWYVLAEPTTSIVNEPLRKIGDYADSITGVTIPTLSTADTFDVDTTLKPSEVSLSYTGWHDAEVKEWDGSEWQ